MWLVFLWLAVVHAKLCKPPRLTGEKSPRGRQSSYHVKSEKRDGNVNRQKKIHLFDGIRVFDSLLVEDRDGQGTRRVASQLLDVPDTVTSRPIHTKEEAVAACMIANGQNPDEGIARKRELLIFYDQEACSFKLVHQVSNFYAGSNPVSPNCIVEDSNLAVLKTWNGIDSLLVASK
jgi:hypothetical protein